MVVISKVYFQPLSMVYLPKVMRSWQSEIKPGDIQAVSSFILTKLVGTNVAGGKEPQGVIYDAAANATTITNDSTTVVNTTDSTKK
jgi:hypothetical protein